MTSLPASGCGPPQPSKSSHRRAVDRRHGKPDLWITASKVPDSHPVRDLNQRLRRTWRWRPSPASVREAPHRSRPWRLLLVVARRRGGTSFPRRLFVVITTSTSGAVRIPFKGPPPGRDPPVGTPRWGPSGRDPPVRAYLRPPPSVPVGYPVSASRSGIPSARESPCLYGGHSVARLVARDQ